MTVCINKWTWRPAVLPFRTLKIIQRSTFLLYIRFLISKCWWFWLCPYIARAQKQATGKFTCSQTVISKRKIFAVNKFPWFWFHLEVLWDCRIYCLAFYAPPSRLLWVLFNAQIGELDSNEIKIAKYSRNTLIHKSANVWYIAFSCQNSYVRPATSSNVWVPLMKWSLHILVCLFGVCFHLLVASTHRHSLSRLRGNRKNFVPPLAKRLVHW